MKILLDVLIIYVALSFLMAIFVSYIISYMLPKINGVKEIPYGLTWVFIIIAFICWPYLIVKSIIIRNKEGLTEKRAMEDIEIINNAVDEFNKEEDP